MTALAAERCRNHADREAAARCPECRRYFCRECVTEHEGRMVCAGCLSGRPAAPAEAAVSRFSGRLRAVRRGLRLMAGLLVAWMSFYLLGQALTLGRDPAHQVPVQPAPAETGAGSAPDPAPAISPEAAPPEAAPPP